MTTNPTTTPTGHRPSACTIEIPIGPLGLLIGDDDVVLAAGFTTPQDLLARLDPDHDGPLAETDGGKVAALIADYFDGRIDALDEIDVDQPGTTLQHETWSALRAIPAGETRTYTELAAMTSNPRAVRAAGTACGANLIAPLVPCHRALRSDGSLGGYYYGLDTKRWLLDHETAHRP